MFWVLVLSLQHVSSLVVAHRLKELQLAELSWSAARGILVSQPGAKPMSPASQSGFLLYVSIVSFLLMVLGLRFCGRAFSSCREQALLSRCGVQASHSGDFLCSKA